MKLSFELSAGWRSIGCAVALVVIAAASPVVAQGNRQRPPGAATPGAGPGRAPRGGDAKGFPAKPVIDADLAAAEEELAQYMQFRGDVGADGAGRLELLIDLRILSRWCLLGAASAATESDLQAAGYLRAQDLLAASRVLAEHFKTLPKPSQPQIDAMNKIHALTFNLPEIKQAKQIDDICREVGYQLITAAGPLPPEVKQVPLMRPQFRKPAGDATAPAAPAPEVDPISRANLLTVTPALKKQVVALATAAGAARKDVQGTDAKKRDEATALIAMTNRTLEIAEGMSRNAGLDATSRPKLEQQLADGLALYADPRTRSAGQNRVASLDAYAQTLARMKRLNLKPEIQQRLAPAFVWAAEHPEQGPKLMASVEAYLAACNRMDSRPAVASSLGQREGKVVTETLKTCAADRETFLTDVATLSAPGVVVDPALYSQRVTSINKGLDAADMYERAPKALATLLTFKPKPTGNLERRVIVAWTTLAENKPTPARDEAAKTMADIVKLADLAADVDSASVPPDVALAYARNKLPAFEARRKEIIADAASWMASGKELDTGRVARLEQIRSLRAAVAEAVPFEAAMRKAEALGRWVDWSVDPADLKVVFDPYRETVAGQIEAFTAPGDVNPNPQWSAIHARYSPVMRLISRTSSYADICVLLPTGWPGHAGRLMTPTDGQPFAPERYAAFCLKLWARYEQGGDSKSAGVVGDALAARAKAK